MLTLHAESMTTPTLYTALSEQLIDCVMSELPALSRCIAVVCAAVPDQTTPTVTKFLSDIKVCDG